jgi:hypothetical protein
MQVDWGERLNNARNTHPDDIEDVGVVFQEEEDVAVTRTQTLNRQRLVVLIKGGLHDSWVR